VVVVGGDPREGIYGEREGMFADFKDKIISAAKGYPLKDRVFYASLVCGTLFLTTRRNLHTVFSQRHLEPWELIAICAFSVGQLFEPRGRWFMFFSGIGFGDLLLYWVLNGPR